MNITSKIIDLDDFLAGVTLAITSHNGVRAVCGGGKGKAFRVLLG